MTRQRRDLRVEHSSFEGRIDVARQDITPPVGIYSRMWGSAVHDVAEGIHRPLSVTMLAMQSLDEGDPLLLASLDLGWWRSSQDEWFLREKVLEALSLDESQLMLHMTHTHSGPSVSLETRDKPGGHLIEPYLLSVCQAVIEATFDALDSATEATLTWHTGRCDLASKRDQPNPEGPGMVVGYQPDVKADDTLLVGRVTDPEGKITATLVNYACHPTTLGGANRLISPDYVGAMRELVEAATGGAPCLFLGGAAGDLAPRRQYSDDPAVADQNGRQLGYAALSTLSGMLPPRAALEFERVEDSGTKLGRWHLTSVTADRVCRSQLSYIHLPLKSLAQLKELERQLEECNDRVMAERLERQLHLHRGLGDSGTVDVPVWIWQLGGAVLLGAPTEMHSPFQALLRRQFAGRPIVVMNLTNGTVGYLPPREDYPLDTYQSSSSPFEPGCHETILAACVESIKQLGVDASTPSSTRISRTPRYPGRRGNVPPH